MFKQIVHFVVITAFFTQTLTWAASTPANSGPSPENSLVESVIALQGQNISQTAMQKQMVALMTQYNSVADHTGQLQRFQQALVDLGVYTSAQAAEFTASAAAAASKVGSTSAQSVDVASKAMVTEIQQLAANHPVGAQFAGCFDVESPGFAALLAGGLGLAIGLGIRFDTTDCTSQDLGSTDYYDSNGNYIGTSENYGPQSCQNVPNDPGTNRTADYIAIGGGVLIGVGALLMLFGVGTSC